MSNIKKKFIGSLEEISPTKIIDEEKDDQLANFFLILSMVFNDLKSFLFFEKLLEESYEQPDLENATVHLGEYAGLKVHVQKNLIGITSEFLLMLRKNSDLLNIPRLQLLVRELKWDELIDSAKNPNSLYGNIYQIRSTITMHYDHQRKALRKGFMRSFFGEGKDIKQHKNAYYRIGDKMENTRFFYADAAVEDYIKSVLNMEDMGKVTKVIEDMTHTIYSLLKEYIKMCKKKK